MTYDERIAAIRARLEPAQKILREYGADLIVESEVDAGVILNRQGRRLLLRVKVTRNMRFRVIDMGDGACRCYGSEGKFRRWLEETFCWSKAEPPEVVRPLQPPRAARRSKELHHALPLPPAPAPPLV